MPEEARRRDDGQLGLHAGQKDALQPDERSLKHGRQSQSDQQAVDPVPVLTDQHVVDEHLDHCRNG